MLKLQQHIVKVYEVQHSVEERTSHACDNLDGQKLFAPHVESP